MLYCSFDIKVIVNAALIRWRCQHLLDTLYISLSEPLIQSIDLPMWLLDLLMGTLSLMFLIHHRRIRNILQTG